MLSTSEIERLLRNQKETQDFAAKLFLRSNIRESYSTLHEKHGLAPSRRRMRPLYCLMAPCISDAVLCHPTIQPMTSALESHRRYPFGFGGCGDRRDIVIQAKASHLYFAKMSLMIFSATAFCDAKNR
jgi:hypothetical protein